MTTMELDKVFLISFWFIVSVLYSMSIWRGWAEKMYEKKQKIIGLGSGSAFLKPRSHEKTAYTLQKGPLHLVLL